MKRQIKKSVIHYQNQGATIDPGETRERSRENNQKAKSIEVNTINRSARMQALKRAREAQQKQNEQLATPNSQEIIVTIQSNQRPYQEPHLITEEIKPVNIHNNQVKKQEEVLENDESQEEEPNIVMLKPVFISKENRENKEKDDEQLKQEEKKKKILRYTTKLLLQEDYAANQAQDEEVSDSDDQNLTNIPDDNDNIDEQYQYELWKIRELKRIRKSQEERHKFEVEKRELERRRNMSNQQILLENQRLGSDSTDNLVEMKYVFMQRYYHKGAFYQDSEDPIFKREYNLPTPMEMQDKTMLPTILQKRMGSFGKKGQSKHTHLVAQDTTNTNPLTRPDQSLMALWKKKQGGYKNNSKSNI